MIPFYDSIPPSPPSRRSLEPAYPCVVVIGPDHVGKSALLRELAARGHGVVSCDADFLEPPYAMLAPLRAAWTCGMAAGHAYSREFLLTGLSLPLVYLRDEMLRRRRRERVVVDSYYYKVLAKCRLLGLDAAGITDTWRAFPAPDLILVLRASDEVLWERAGRGGTLNPFEHYGKEPTRAAYLAFQHDLLRAMLDGAKDIPAWEIDGNETLDRVRRQAEDLMGRAHELVEQKQVSR